ncbi:MAG: hypothetical protein E7I00_01280 [Varibaculum cambriense]|nr:hypothetical protein [Varibaculum cambriense]
MSILLTIGFLLCGAALVFLVARSVSALNARDRARKTYFEQEIGSVENLLASSLADRDKLRQMRDQGRLQRWDAIRDVMREEGVPEEVATEFIDRL